MKNLIFILLIIAFANLKAQIISVYDKSVFINPKATWHVAETYIAATLEHPSFAATTTRIYGYVGDTVINNNKWQKMFSTSDSIFTSTAKLAIQGYLREDKGFIIFLNTSFIEDTLYNFNLKTGDSVLYNFDHYQVSSWLKIKDTDSVKINGKKHKIYYFSEPDGPNAFTQLREVWMEGIGSIHGPLFPASPRVFAEECPDSMNLTCFNINDTIEWENPVYNNCYINIVLGINQYYKQKTTFKMYPIPASNYINIKAPSQAIVDICDITGKSVYSVTLKLENSTINVSFLNDGLYLLLINAEGMMTKQKIIIRH